MRPASQFARPRANAPTAAREVGWRTDAPYRIECANCRFRLPSSRSLPRECGHHGSCWPARRCACACRSARQLPHGNTMASRWPAPSYGRSGIAGAAARPTRAGHHGPGESRLRPRRAGDTGALHACSSRTATSSATRCIRSRARGSSSCRCIAASPIHPCSSTQPGIVTLGCNIHDNMLAYIVVTTAPCFGRTGCQREMGACRICPRAGIGCASGIRCSTSRSKSSGPSTPARTSNASKSGSRAPCVPRRSTGGRTHGTTDAQTRDSLAVRVPASRRRRRRPEIGSSRSICAP